MSEHLTETTSHAALHVLGSRARRWLTGDIQRSLLEIIQIHTDRHTHTNSWNYSTVNVCVWERQKERGSECVHASVCRCTLAHPLMWVWGCLWHGLHSLNQGMSRFSQRWIHLIWAYLNKDSFVNKAFHCVLKWINNIISSWTHQTEVLS